MRSPDTSLRLPFRSVKSQMAPRVTAATGSGFSVMKSMTRAPVSPGLVADVGDDVLGLPGDRVLGLLLEVVGAEPLAQRVDIAAHPLPGALDLVLDLLRRPLVR